VRTVSTSGSSGKDVEDDRPVLGRLVAELVRAEHELCGRGRFVVGARVDLGDRLATLDLVAPLAQTDDADRVVDRVVLARATRAELKRRDPDRKRAKVA
jgi:hypothetical protein